MNRFKIRHTIKTPLETIAKYGTVILDSHLWRDEVILETELSFNEVCRLPFVLAVRNLYNEGEIYE